MINAQSKLGSSLHMVVWLIVFVLLYYFLKLECLGTRRINISLVFEMSGYFEACMLDRIEDNCESKPLSVLEVPLFGTSFRFFHTPTTPKCPNKSDCRVPFSVPLNAVPLNFDFHHLKAIQKLYTKLTNSFDERCFALKFKNFF